jgi:hypothetical protein
MSILDIVEACHISEYRIRMSFSDGTERVMDFASFLKKAGNPDLAKYRDLNEFKSFRLHYGNLMWGDYEMVFPIEDLHSGHLSLEQEGSVAEIDAAWKKEIRERIKASEQGLMSTRSGDDVMREAYERFK